MISQEILKKLATEYHTSEYPNIAREYCQHLLLSELYKIQGSEELLFKGGTALRILYGSPRFSEDLDFSIGNKKSYLHKNFIEHLFTASLASIEHRGIKIELGAKPGPTAEGYYGEILFYLSDYPPLALSINISSRNKNIRHEVDSVANDFIPVYNIFHLSLESLVEEKIFGALIERKKARDFYDLYFIMRKGMLSIPHKKRLAQLQSAILGEAAKLDFKSELSVFLPTDQQNIIKDFKSILADELHRQLASSDV